MVHTRINERETNPNPFINFISALPPLDGGRTSGSVDADAKELLRALAAQLKPVMKNHGLTVNCFEEYESNKVFLGRNWNNGETIELVLRDGNGQFYSVSRLLSVFCHELAHIKHMNHSPAFHALRRQLSAEVTELQRNGYYGDGYWSAGTRLSDSQRVLGIGQNAQELPEYTCGGAISQARNSALPSRRRRRRRIAGPSLSSGAQTTKRRKAGSRVTARGAFDTVGGGSVLDGNVEKGGKGSGFRKQAGSNRAREERARAAEQRLLQMSENASSRDESNIDSDSTEDYEDDLGLQPETDKDRLHRMRLEMGQESLDVLRDDDDDVVVVSFSGDTGQNAHETTTKSEVDKSDADRTIKRAESSIKDTVGARGAPSLRTSNPISGSSCSSKPNVHTASKPRAQFGFKEIASQEIQQRQREAIGLDGEWRLGACSGESAVIGGSHKRTTDTQKHWTCGRCTFLNDARRTSCEMCEAKRGDSGGVDTRPLSICDGGSPWACSICTFQNQENKDICDICGSNK